MNKTFQITDKTDESRGSKSLWQDSLPIDTNYILTDIPLLEAIKSLSAIASTENNYISVDFENIESILENHKIAYVSMHIAEGEHRVANLIEKLRKSSIWENFDIKTVKNIVLKFICSRNSKKKISEDELMEIKILTETFPESINVQWVISDDPSLGDRLKLIFLAC